MISYIIVTWNNEKIILDCIDSLREFSPFENEIIIVDNNSNDKTIEVIDKKAYNDVRVINTGENLGFAKANNLGLNMANGEYVFFVNPDVVFIEDIVTPMLNILQTYEDVGIVSPKLLYKDKRFQVSTCNFPSVKKVFWDDLHFYKLLSEKKMMRLAQAQYRGNENHIVDWSYGAAQLCRAEEVKSIGGYPEDYFMYGEDTEFCMKYVHKLGKKNYYLMSSQLIHLGGYSEGQVLNSKKIVYGTEAALYFVDKYYGKKELFLYKSILLFSSYVKYIYYSVKRHFNKSQKIENLKMRWKASYKTILQSVGNRKEH